MIKKRKWKAAIEMVDSDAWVLADVDTPQVALQVSRLLEDLISDMPGAELRSNIRSKS